MNIKERDLRMAIRGEILKALKERNKPTVQREEIPTVESGLNKSYALVNTLFSRMTQGV